MWGAGSSKQREVQEPGSVNAACRGLCSPGLASSTSRPDRVLPRLLTVPPLHRRCSQPALSHMGQGASCLIFLRLTPS